MSDITMCTAKIQEEGKETVECPKREQCYRFTATPNQWRQSYFMAPPLEDGKCKYFSSNEGYK